MLGAIRCAPSGRDVSGAEFKLSASAVEAFCIAFTAAKFLDLLGKCHQGVIFRGSLNHLASFRADSLAVLCLTLSKLLASFQTIKLTLQIPRLQGKREKKKKVRAKIGITFPLASLLGLLLQHTVSGSLIF